MASMSRRNLLRAGVAGGVAGTLFEAPAFASADSRPVITHGVQSGDATADSAVVWARADRPGRLWVQASRRPDFRGSRVVRGPLVTPETGLTGKVRLRGLPAGERIHYRARVESLDRPGRFSLPVDGTLRTAPTRRADIRFVWTGDVAGQGWGIDPEHGGMRLFESARLRRPDFFLHSGDTVYADGPLAETVTLPDGRIWRNLLTDAKLKVAETLDEYRGQYAYNLLDDAYRRFVASVPQINQWDDHEVTNNWYPGEILDDARYTEKRVDVLAARAHQAYHEWVPTPQRTGPVYRKIPYGPLLDVFVLDMRTVKDPNDGNTYADRTRGLLGREQRQWLIDGLRRSRATWKVIANDLPLGLVVPDGAVAQEGVAQGDAGRPAGREIEFAEVLRAAHRHGVTGIVFLTADVHYTAAHHYDPARAAVADFTPFWEFVSGPAHAGAFGPNALDGTFGPEAVFVHAPPVANTSPALGYQHFGEVEIDGESGAFTVHLRDRDGVALWSTTLRP
ncbi:alkaline phosphatase D family protein [Actinoplanes teichomyceticus]|uniref:Alkaline phosphatase D n=1 Tax=Actinoplanes teichomyceticus TaxID=1867 RepID=A0A561WHY7_ACTTI|nr:alkaline phosphatase D family protein [Actinoplanes teichomyceticus]TWG23476.1 alkaline phosphatase D [Actinoplanes teichomyceticus]GIF16099.1 alkaline phosphatase [Actinoplanes teichomyceticus]